MRLPVFRNHAPQLITGIPLVERDLDHLLETQSATGLQLPRDLGGNSLIALQVLAKLKKTFQVQLPVVALFEAPTISALVDYLLPTTTEVPEIEVGHLETDSTTNPGGFKGMGEGGAIGSHAAVANAIGDALAPLGIDVLSTPLGPNDIHRLMVDAGAA